MTSRTGVLKTPRQLTRGGALESIADGELVALTHQSVRLRRRVLRENDRARAERRERDTAGAPV